MNDLAAAADRVRRQRDAICTRMVYLPDRDVEKYADWVAATNEANCMHRQDLERLADAYLAMVPDAIAVLKELEAVHRPWPATENDPVCKPLVALTPKRYYELTTVLEKAAALGVTP